MKLALLLVAAVVAATVSGATGFGGALLLLPTLVFVVGVKAAVPLLTLAQLGGNLSRAAFGWRDIAWRPVGVFLTGCIPGAVAGALLFVRIPEAVATRIVGISVLALVAVRRFKPGLHLPRRWLAPAGLLLGLASGLVGSVGPLQAVVFLGLRLPPTAFVATEAAAAMVLHLVKLSAYGGSSLLTNTQWGLGLTLALAMVLGSWIGRRLLERVPDRVMACIIEITLVASGVALLFR